MDKAKTSTSEKHFIIIERSFSRRVKKAEKIITTQFPKKQINKKKWSCWLKVCDKTKNYLSHVAQTQLHSLRYSWKKSWESLSCMMLLHAARLHPRFLFVFFLALDFHAWVPSTAEKHHFSLRHVIHQQSKGISPPCEPLARTGCMNARAP